MNSKIVLSVIVVVLSVQGFEGTIVTGCMEGMIPEVTVTSGGNECIIPPCKVKVGDSIAFEMNFTAPYTLSTIKSVLYRNVAIEKDACPNIINTHCPIPRGQLVVHKDAITITKAIEGVELMAMAILDSTTEECIACFNLSIKNA